MDERVHGGRTEQVEVPVVQVMKFSPHPDLMMRKRKLTLTKEVKCNDRESFMVWQLTPSWGKELEEV